MTSWTRRDAVACAALAAISALIRIPFRSTQIFHCDSYGLSMGALFTWTAHPPGFIGYCTLGRLVNYLADDVNVAFVAVNILSTAIATALVFALGRAMFGYAQGLIGAVFFAVSIDASYYAEVALTYAAEGMCATAAAWSAWMAISRRSPKWLMAHAVILALGGSVRQTTLAFLLPLSLYAMWKATRRWSVRAAAVALLFAGVLVWLVPNARNVRKYWVHEQVGFLRSVYDLQVRMPQYYDSSAFGRVEYETTRQRFHWPLVELAVGAWNRIHAPSATAPPEVRSADVGNAARMIRYQSAKFVCYLIFACGAWGLFVFFGLRRLEPEQRAFFVLWIVPAALFFMLNHFGSWGYLLLFLGAFALLAARGLLIAAPRRATAIAAFVAAVQLSIFIFMRPLPERSDREILINTAVLQYGAPSIRNHFSRARSAAFSVEKRELPLDCVTPRCLEQSIPRDFSLPPDLKPMRPLVRR